MSDHWGHYLADMGGHQGSIVFDDGIAAVIKGLPETTSILVTVDLIETNDAGMTTDSEAERLEILQDVLEDLIKDVGGYNVGRVTSNKKRHLFYYVGAVPDDFTAKLEGAAIVTGHMMRVGTRDDPEKSAYFEDLYPDPESRQVASDMDLISVLIDKGDDISAERRIDHLSIFDSASGAKAFVVWAEQAGYEVEPIRKEGLLLTRKFYVETHNVTAVTVYDINPHSLGHFRKAKELGGEYDGWGTPMVQVKEYCP